MLPVQFWGSQKARPENSFFLPGKKDDRHFQINLMNKIYTEISHTKLTYTSKIVQLTTSPTPNPQIIKRFLKNYNIKLICFAWKE